MPLPKYEEIPFKKKPTKKEPTLTFGHWYWPLDLRKKLKDFTIDELMANYELLQQKDKTLLKKIEEGILDVEDWKHILKRTIKQKQKL